MQTKNLNLDNQLSHFPQCQRASCRPAGPAAGGFPPAAPVHCRTASRGARSVQPDPESPPAPSTASSERQPRWQLPASSCPSPSPPKFEAATPGSRKSALTRRSGFLFPLTVRPVLGHRRPVFRPRPASPRPAPPRGACRRCPTGARTTRSPTPARTIKLRLI